jgi:HD domain-containing protein
MIDRDTSTTTTTRPNAWTGSPFESDPGPQGLAGPLIDDDSSGSETEAILFALAQAVEQRDPHTARHCERLALIGVALGTAMHLDRTSLSALYRGGYLHDIGKVGIPDAILFKPGKLTAEEWLVMRTHPARGEEICCHLKSLHPVLPIIRHHHERWDGSGYPDGLRGAQIPLLARVLQVADIYDALTSPRPYKHAYPVKQALHIIEKETQAGWRDPGIVTLFFQLHGKVITRIDEYTSKPDGHLEALQAALGRMDAALSSNEFPAPRGRRSFPPLRSARAGDSPWGAEDMWRTE